MIRGVSLALRTMLVLIAGCYWSYMGYYRIPPSIVEGPAAEKALIAELEQVILPLGFERLQIYEERERAFAYSNKLPIAVNTKGDEKWEPYRLGVVADFELRRILIQDLDHDYETAFIRSLKEAIEKRLKDRYGLTELKFVQIKVQLN